MGSVSAEFRTDALRVLLAYLAAYQGRFQRRDTLAGLLAPDRPNKAALTYLRNRLSRLRRAIGDNKATPPYFEIDRKQILLRSGDDIAIDLIAFDQHLHRVETHPHRTLAGCPDCLSHLQAAVDLVRGELLAGLNFPSETWEAWLMAQREHYQRRALDAMTLLRDARLELEEWEAAIEIAQRQLSAEPWIEAAHRAIMLAYFQLGDRSSALAQYEACERILYEELGVDPDSATLELVERMKAEGGRVKEDVVRRPSSVVPNNLPVPTGGFFGRNREQARLLPLLVNPNHRLITLVGAGGIGKTRLSIEAGKQVMRSFPDGVWFVPLDAVKGGAEQIQVAVGEALGLGQPDKQLTGDQVLAILRDKRMLLIFDNSEPVLEEIAFIPEWLRRAPELAILATSREPLNFQAETVVMIDGLPIGDEEMGAAEALFEERGKMAHASFVISAENLPHVRKICQLVDGSPLGIGLAAAWVRRRSLTQIIDSIGRSLDFLTTRMRDMSPRHRSMRAVFETSWQLLEEIDQQTLAALSVFPTDFSADAAAAVANASLFDLDVLAEKSMLQQDQVSERYLMHGLVRQFSAEKLPPRTEEINRAFVDYCFAYANKNRQTYKCLTPEWFNLLAGIQTADALRLTQTVLDFVQILDEAWFRQSRWGEMRTGLTLAVGAAADLQQPAQEARLLLRLAEVEIEQSDYDSAETHLSDSLQQFLLEEDDNGIANVNYFLGRLKEEVGKDEEASTLLNTAMQIFESQNNSLGVAKCLNLLAVCEIKLNKDFDTAQTYLERSIVLQRALPRTASYVATLRNLARVETRMQAYESAEKHLATALSASQAQDDIGEQAAVLFEYVILYKHSNQIETALTLGYDCLDKFKKIGHLRGEAVIRSQLGMLHRRNKQYQQSIEQLTAALHIFQEVGNLFEEAFHYFDLHEMYAQIGKVQQSIEAKRHATRINRALKDLTLTKLLAQSSQP